MKMKRKDPRTIALRGFALVVALGAAWQAQAQDAKAPYPSMAPLNQYLMERNAEVALARSAAPESRAPSSLPPSLQFPLPAQGRNPLWVQFAPTNEISNRWLLSKPR